jgi:hypothetical protein
VGAIMYEMMVGYPPFCSDEPITTCRKIINWRQHLRFPDDARLSPDAVDLMRRLLCDVDSRLGTQVETPLVFTTSVRAGSARLLPWLDVLAMSHARSAESNRAHDAPWRACPRA